MKNVFEVIEWQKGIEKKLYQKWDKGQTVFVTPELLTIVKTIAHQYLVDRRQEVNASIENPKIHVLNP